MARMESKSISVLPNEEQEAIQKHEMFGWILKSSQEIFNQSTKQEARGDEIWNVTTTTNYIKLLFQRDMDMPSIDRIRPLEEEYWNNFKASKYPPSKLPGKVICGLSIVLVFVGFLNISSGEGAGPILSGILFILAAAGILAARHFLSYVPQNKKWIAAVDRCKEIEHAIAEIFRIE